MKLFLKNFRSHKKLELDLEPITIIIGPNGSGKTNILEAVSFISAARSFRVEDKKNLIADGADFCTIKLQDNEAIISRIPRTIATFKIKGVKKRIYDFVGRLPSVVFNPESLQIINGSPSERRRFMDSLLAQTSTDYFKALIDYKKILVRRNKVLQAIADYQADENQLDFWDEEMAAAASIIIQEREALATFLRESFPRLYLKIAKKKDLVELAYRSQIEGEVLTKIRQKRPIEIHARTTIFGPHRDDLEFLINSHQASNYASRGEIRSMILALKLAELKFIDKMKSEEAAIPTLLLDDVFSELDKHHRDHIHHLVKDYPTIITTTDLDHLSKELKERAELLEL